MTAAKDLLEGKRILLVDDEPDVLDTLADLLPMCETVKASDFKTAKNYLESEYFDLAILDIMGVEGYQLLKIANQKGVTATNIASFLTDILEAQEQGKSTWIRWYDRLGSFFEKKFGHKWQDDEKEFWEKFPFY
jgi:CheY-like chemotaxis protein